MILVPRIRDRFPTTETSYADNQVRTCEEQSK